MKLKLNQAIHQLQTALNIREAAIKTKNLEQVLEADDLVGLWEVEINLLKGMSEAQAVASVFRKNRKQAILERVKK